MREKIYLRIGKTKAGYKYSADRKKSNKPFDNGYYSKTYFPTITVALNIEIPDKVFKDALQELNLKIKDAEFATDIKIEEEKTEGGKNV